MHPYSLQVLIALSAQECDDARLHCQERVVGAQVVAMQMHSLEVCQEESEVPRANGSVSLGHHRIGTANAVERNFSPSSTEYVKAKEDLMTSEVVGLQLTPMIMPQPVPGHQQEVYQNLQLSPGLHRQG